MAYKICWSLCQAGYVKVRWYYSLTYVLVAMKLFQELYVMFPENTAIAAGMAKAAIATGDTITALSALCQVFSFGDLF